jgi:SHS2 domain-containing protein
MEKETGGFREIEHTADWELEVWAPDLLALLEQAALGMYTLSGTRLANGQRQLLSLEVEASDAESLLVSFLSELLYLGEQKGLGFDRFDLHLDGEQMHARLEGAPIVSRDKEIKAVTYHRLKIQEAEEGLRVNIVLDV